MKVAGSYFRSDFPLGLGMTQPGVTFADQALIGIVQGQPSLVYTEWASRDDGTGVFTDSSSPSNYQAYAISDLQLVAVANTTSSEVTTLCVISPTLSRADLVAKTFEGTPFQYTHTEAVYAQADTRNPPAIYYVYWLALRDGTDPKTGPTSLNYAATLLLGVLAYVVFIAPAASDRARPTGSFSSAQAQQSSGTPLQIPSTPAQQQTTPALPSPSASPAAPAPVLNLPSPAAKPAQASAANTGRGLFLVALGAVAAFGTYWLVSRGRSA